MSDKLILFILFILAFLVWIFPGSTPADAQARWELCQDGQQIARCLTYDCPNGDTNGDGACNLSDNGGRVVSARNDALCSNPTSGCGQTHYFSAQSASSCSVRVKENTLNCDLYAVGNPQFTPAPTIQPITESQNSPIASPTPLPSVPPAQNIKELPETGSEIFGLVFLIVLGFSGIYLYERFRLN